MTAKYRRELASWPYRLFLVGLAIALFHLTEDALVHKENGSSLGAQRGSTAINLLLVAAGALLYPLIWRRARPILRPHLRPVGAFRAWRAHVADVLDGEAAGGDYTGIAYALASLLFIGIAIALAFDSWRGRAMPA